MLYSNSFQVTICGCEGGWEPDGGGGAGTVVCTYEAVPIGVAMVVAVVGVVVVLPQQFLPMEVVLIQVGVVAAEMAERCPLTLVVFLVESGPGVPLHCMFPQTQVLSFLR